MAGDDAQGFGTFANGLRDDADLIESGCKRDEAPAADTAVRRLEAEDAAKRGGLANRPAGFRA